MNKEISDRINIVNERFSVIQYLPKRSRNIKVLEKMLLYKCALYKRDIDIIQTFPNRKLKKKLKIHDRELVACAIAGRHKKNGALGSSHNFLKNYNKELLTALNGIGSIGGQSNVIGCNNAVGKCAEIKVANTLLQNDKHSQIVDIEFTTARRPRTSEPMKRCGNCITIFGNEIP